MDRNHRDMLAGIDPAHTSFSQTAYETARQMKDLAVSCNALEDERDKRQAELNDIKDRYKFASLTPPSSDQVKNLLEWDQDGNPVGNDEWVRKSRLDAVIAERDRALDDLRDVIAERDKLREDNSQMFRKMLDTVNKFENLDKLSTEWQDERDALETRVKELEAINITKDDADYLRKRLEEAATVEGDTIKGLRADLTIANEVISEKQAIIERFMESELKDKSDLDEAVRLLRDVRPFVDHADSQFVDYPYILNPTIDAFLAKHKEAGK